MQVGLRISGASDIATRLTCRLPLSQRAQRRRYRLWRVQDLTMLVCDPILPFAMLSSSARDGHRQKRRERRQEPFLRLASLDICLSRLPVCTMVIRIINQILITVQQTIFFSVHRNSPHRLYPNQRSLVSSLRAIVLSCLSCVETVYLRLSSFQANVLSCLLRV